MRCFNHPEVDAVCSCKSCLVFLCTECAIKIEHGYVCSESCRENIEAIEQYHQFALQEHKNIDRANEIVMRAMLARKKNYSHFIGFYILMALVTLASGIDRADYSYSVTFIAIFVILICYCAVRIRSLNVNMDELLDDAKNRKSVGE
ncbi:hypothetical protein ACRZ5S_15565 [Vibrio scophthalmi]|uniref:B box-type domain-containing protein n=1 Tax=Vibrio scophthalmi TaxID=45658 RepID=A0A1E3WIG1_9VIBR|nr:MULTISPECIES: hypothetical protein [Vibrio]EGU35268.1 hypothetical protein VIBRN418_09683 [Vibrio sp. N418]ODS05591.1 hypothetical protein VSF3289_04732 [Vibrio scophthalmi]